MLKHIIYAYFCNIGLIVISNLTFNILINKQIISNISNKYIIVVMSQTFRTNNYVAVDARVRLSDHIPARP